MRSKNTVFMSMYYFAFLLIASGYGTELQNDNSPKIHRDSTIQELKKMVVTATKRSRNVSDIPVSATIIGKEEIRLSEAKNIDDLLQYTFGVQVKRPVGMGEGVPSDIIMRGIPGAIAATRTLILVDGIPTNLAGTPFLILNEIPLEAVKRIEVIRGPFSSIYGANAFGGVINIITDIGDGRPSTVLTGETSFPFTSLHNYNNQNRQTGSDFWKENARLAFWNFSKVTGAGNEKADILLAGGFRTIGNYYLKDSALVRKGDAKRHKDKSNHDYTDYRLFLKNSLRLTDQIKNTVHLRFFNSDLGFGKTGTDPDSDITTKGKKILIGDYVEYSPLENIHLKMGGFFRTVNGEYADRVDSIAFAGDSIKTYRKVPTFWNASSRDVQGEGCVIFSPGELQTLIAGFDVLHNSIHFGALRYRSSNDIRVGEIDIDKTFWNFGAYIQDEITLMGFNVIPAIRSDFHSNYGWMISPKLGISSRLLDRVTIRSSIGTAFRAPSSTELYANVIFGDVKVFGNPQLDPERVFAIDGGFEVNIFSGINAASNLFYNKMSNLITFSFDRSTFDMVLKDKAIELTHGNIDKAYSWGSENELSISRFKPLNVKLCYTFTQTKNEVTKKTLDYIPAHKASAEVGISQKTGSGTINCSIKEGFVGSRNYQDWSVQPDLEFRLDGIHYIFHYVTLKPYWRTDISLSYTFKNDHVLSLNAQNFFDATIEENGGNYSPGRFLSLKYSVPLNW